MPHIKQNNFTKRNDIRYKTHIVLKLDFRGCPSCPIAVCMKLRTIFLVFLHNSNTIHHVHDWIMQQGDSPHCHDIKGNVWHREAIYILHIFKFKVAITNAQETFIMQFYGNNICNLSSWLPILIAVYRHMQKGKRVAGYCAQLVCHG